MTELAGRHRLVEPLVGGGDDPHVHVKGAVAAQAPDLATVQRAEELGLHRLAHLGDLVEEERSVVGELEETLALADRAREGALLVPEQLRLEQLVQQRGAVDGQKRLIAPLADPVHVARSQLLAAAALALDEDVRVRVARARQELPQPLYGAALALHGGLGLAARPGSRGGADGARRPGPRPRRARLGGRAW